MKLVVLDGHTLNPGDLNWDGLRRLGPCEIYERSAPAEVVPRAADAGMVLTNKTVITRDHFAALPGLRYVGVLATGFNVVDAVAAAERGIPVTNIPTYGTRSVAQMTFALLLELTQHAGHHAQTVREGRWTKCPDFSYWDHPLIELDGLTLGLVGLGRIGRAVAELGVAFGMRVVAHAPRPPVDRPGWIELSELDPLFARSDVVSLHCPLTPETRGVVNPARLARMKRTAFLLNTSRGPLVDEAALAAALNDGQIAGAGLDVLTVEPPSAANPLLRAKNCLITPHLAWATRAARARLMETAVANVAAFRAGRPENVVNGVNHSGGMNRL